MLSLLYRTVQLPFSLLLFVAIALTLCSFGFWPVAWSAQRKEENAVCVPSGITGPLTRSDLEAVIAVPRVQLEAERQVADMPYLLYLDAVERLPDGIHSDALQIIMANRAEHYTFAIPAPYSTDMVWQQINTNLERNHPARTVLFSCTGQLCGRNNIWANQVFRQRRLLGLDATQHYQVIRLQHADILQYLIIYVVQRGTKAVYVQMNLITTTQTSEPLLS